jgi:hypothetical protein
MPPKPSSSPSSDFPARPLDAEDLDQVVGGGSSTPGQDPLRSDSAKSPGSSHARPLSSDDLDRVVGGASVTAAVDPHRFDQGGGFDAAAMQSGIAPTDVANAGPPGDATLAQAMHLLETAAVGGHVSVTEALASFAAHAGSAAEPAADAKLIGAEIAALIATNQTTSVQAMADIGKAVTSHALTPNQAIALLAGLAATGSAALQSAAGGAIAAMVDHNQISAEQAVADVHRAVTSHALTAEQAVGLLAGAGIRP